MKCRISIDGSTRWIESPPIDAVGLHQRAAFFRKRSIKNGAKLTGLRLVVAMIDLTTLEGKDTPGTIAHLCRKARFPMSEKYDVPSCAAVCVYPNHVKPAACHLSGTPVQVASVATAFPSGQVPIGIKIREVRQAINDGATEIDMVINRGAFLSGKYQIVVDEIRAVKEACGDIHLKVILETGELGSYDNIRLASDIAMLVGADFIKTSTGKIDRAATMPVTLCMLEAIRDHFFAQGTMIGMKPAGGIRTAKESLHYLVMLKETLGAGWFSPSLFRFGASSLLTDVTLQIGKYVDGVYQNPDYHSIG